MLFESRSLIPYWICLIFLFCWTKKSTPHLKRPMMDERMSVWKEEDIFQIPPNCAVQHYFRVHKIASSSPFHHHWIKSKADVDKSLFPVLDDHFLPFHNRYTALSTTAHRVGVLMANSSTRLLFHGQSGEREHVQWRDRLFFLAALNWRGLGPGSGWRGLTSF